MKPPPPGFVPPWKVLHTPSPDALILAIAPWPILLLNGLDPFLLTMPCLPGKAVPPLMANISPRFTEAVKNPSSEKIVHSNTSVQDPFIVTNVRLACQRICHCFVPFLFHLNIKAIRRWCFFPLAHATLGLVLMLVSFWPSLQDIEQAYSWPDFIFAAHLPAVVTSPRPVSTCVKISGGPSPAGNTRIRSCLLSSRSAIS